MNATQIFLFALKKYCQESIQLRKKISCHCLLEAFLNIEHYFYVLILPNKILYLSIIMQLFHL